MKSLRECLINGASELGITLTAEQLDQFTTFARELCKWNHKINLTSIILPEEIAVKHFLDSLTLAQYAESVSSLLDIGSGGGFPGIPLKIVAPAVKVVSVDAVEKKVHFQRHIARTLAFTGFTAVHSRIENLSPERSGTFNCIVSRAFADLSDFVKNALPLLSEGGSIIAMKGKEGNKEALDATDSLSNMGAEVSSIHEFELPILKDKRSLIVIRKKYPK